MKISISTATERIAMICKKRIKGSTLLSPQTYILNLYKYKYIYVYVIYKIYLYNISNIIFASCITNKKYLINAKINVCNVSDIVKNQVNFT